MPENLQMLDKTFLIQIVPPTVAALVTMLLVPITIHLAERFGLADQPSARKVHQTPTPRIGGVAILFGLFAGMLCTIMLVKVGGFEVARPFWINFMGLSIGCAFIWVVGFVDDVRTISSRFKLIALLFASTLVCGSGASLVAVNLGGQNVVEFRWLAFFVTILWLSSISVAVNFIDGLDGLASGLVAFSALVLSLFLLVAGQYPLAGLSLSLAGALVGFLVFNRHPASIFMGDCGSMLIGFCIASLMIMANPLIGSMRAIVLPSLALCIPIVDGTLTFFRRHYQQRRSIFAAERGHIHHRLMDRGLRHQQAVLFIYAVSLTAVAIGFASLALQGLSTLAGLCLLIPLIWGTFRFAGSVKTNEMLTALRSKRYLDRELRKNRESFESFQLEFEKVDSFGSWWNCLCNAAEAMEFYRIDLSISLHDKPRTMIWENQDESLAAFNRIHAGFPIADSANPNASSKIEVDVAVTQTMELAGQRLALFSRLISENSLAVMRQRERSAKNSLAARGIAKKSPKQFSSDELEEKVGEGPFRNLRVALVHDFFYTYSGAERVVEQLINVFPHCDLFSLFDFLPESQRGFLRDKPVTTTFIQHLPFVSTKHRLYLPLMPIAIEQIDVSKYDLIISSSYLAAKGVITGPDQMHISYCHSPVRYAWDLQHQYLRSASLGFGPKGMIARFILHYLRNWDVRTSFGVDHFISNSKFVARRISKLYRRNAKVIHPPVDTDQFNLHTDPREDFYLVAGRMVPYKETDMIVSAFKRMPNRRLVVIGEGPEMEKVKALAGANVTLMGFQESNVLVDHMRRAKALIFAAEEDFGIVPVEALSCGTPVIAYGKGGVTESVIDGKHGVLFDHQTEDSLIDAIERFESKSGFGAFSPVELHERSLEFSNAKFTESIKTTVAGWLSQGNTRPSEAPHDEPHGVNRTEEESHESVGN